MSKNIPNGKMNGKRHTKGMTALFTLNAMLTRSGHEARTAALVGGRLERLSYARAESLVRMGRWNA